MGRGQCWEDMQECAVLVVTYITSKEKHRIMYVQAMKTEGVVAISCEGPSLCAAGTGAWRKQVHRHLSQNEGTLWCLCIHHWC